jgi:hypothetical protein
MWLPIMVYLWDKNTMRMCFSHLHTVHPAHVAMVGASSLAPYIYALYDNSTPYSESIQIGVLEDLIKSRFSGVN